MGNIFTLMKSKKDAETYRKRLVERGEKYYKGKKVRLKKDQTFPRYKAPGQKAYELYTPKKRKK